RRRRRPYHRKLRHGKEGWCLPHTTAREHFEKRPACIRTILRPARTRFPDATVLRQVLDTHHSRVDALLDCDLQRHMSCDRELLLPCLVHNRKERVSRREVVHLDQVNTPALEELNRSPALVRIPDTDPERPISWCIVENRSCSDDLRAECAARRGRFSQIQNQVHGGAHVADTCDAVRHVELERRLSSHLHVCMHVPEAGNNEL